MGIHADRIKSVRLNKVTYDRLKRLSMRSRDPRMTMKDIVAYLVDVCLRYELLDTPTYYAKDRALIFVRHVQDHLTEGRYKSMIFPPDAVVICKICKKTIDEIYEEARA